MKLCQIRLGKAEAIFDTLKREEAMDKLTDEKMEFNSAVEEGRIVLGDTLLHIAVRLNHKEVTYYLLDCQLREDVLNFKSQTVSDCVTSAKMQMVMQDVVHVHATLGFDFKETTKVFHLCRSLRRVWPRWMYDLNEASALLRCISEWRTNHKQYNTIVKLVKFVGTRYEYAVTCCGIRVATKLLKDSDGQIYRAKSEFESWTEEAKRNIVYKAFTDNFIDWERPGTVELNHAYLEFVEHSMDTWISIVEEFRLHRSDEGEVAFPDLEQVKKYEDRLWVKRLHPEPDEIDSICAHINGLENFLHLKGLKAE